MFFSPICAPGPTPDIENLILFNDATVNSGLTTVYISPVISLPSESLNLSPNVAALNPPVAVVSWGE